MKSLVITQAPEAVPSVLGRFKRQWNHSLRFRLMWLGLMPLLLAFPMVLVTLGLVGGNQLNHLIESQLTSNLSGAQNYLHVFRTDLQSTVTELVKNERLEQLVQQRVPRQEINQALFATLRGSEFDFLLMVNAEGTIIGSSNRTDTPAKVPTSFVIQQALVGVATSGFEQFSMPEVAALSPAVAQRLQAQWGLPGHAGSTSSGATSNGPQRTATLVMAAAHLPLSVTAQDVILLGGVLINENTALIEHLREIIYPAGMLPYETEGFAGIFSGQERIISSRLKTTETTDVRLDAAFLPAPGQSEVLPIRVGRQGIGKETYALAVAPLLDGEEQTVGYLAVGFPVGPIQVTAWLLLAMLAGFLGLTMLTVSVIYLNAGRRIVVQIKKIALTMKDFRDGNRAAQIKDIRTQDELGLLSQYVNDLLRIISEQEHELKRTALHDGLTGLANRQNFAERMAFAMATSDRSGQYAALIMLDLDNFKPLNDAHGHAAGDQLLIEVGRRLKSLLREVDLVARFGGDEFLVLIESLTDDPQQAQDRALEVAEKIRAAIDVPFHVTGSDQDKAPTILHHCTASVGVAVFLGKEHSQARILNMADAAMYSAKGEGRNQVSLFEPSASKVVRLQAQARA